MKIRQVLTSLALGGLAIGCGSSSPSYSTAAAVSGPQDMHCTLMDGGAAMNQSYLLVQSTNQGDCQFSPPIDAPPPPGSPDAPPAEPDFGATMYNTSGHDDDCKYFVQWQSTQVDENNNVYFLTKAQFNAATPSMAVTGANIYAEVYLSDTHPAPPTNQTAVESPAGTYKIGPIQFDAAGMWTVRFHLFENCLDYADDSPHGHAAFYVNVK